MTDKHIVGESGCEFECSSAEAPGDRLRLERKYRRALVISNTCRYATEDELDARRAVLDGRMAKRNVRAADPGAHKYGIVEYDSLAVLSGKPSWRLSHTALTKAELRGLLAMVRKSEKKCNRAVQQHPTLRARIVPLPFDAANY